MSLIAATALASCSHMSPHQLQEVRFETVDSQQYSGVEISEQVVARSAAEWSLLWQKHMQFRERHSIPPAVDFSRQMILAVFLGRRPNGCYSVNIERVRLEEGTVVVEYRENVPFGNAFCIYAMTNPSHIVAVPRTEAPVDFREIVPGQ